MTMTDNVVTAPRLRLLPAPQTEPPYDDELPDRDGIAGPWSAGGGTGAPAAERTGSAGVQGTLALTFSLPSGLPATPNPPNRLRLVNGATSTPESGTANGLPDPRLWSARLAQALVEVLAGDRPLQQLVRWTSADVYRKIERRARIVARGDGAERLGDVRAAVRSVHLCEPRGGVAEACMLVQQGARSRAIAIRLEGVDGRWQCTALEFG